MSRHQKADLVIEIAYAIGVAPPTMSTGSTEPRVLFDLVNDALGLGLQSGLTKPEMARAIVEAAGHSWGPSCESRGGTVTYDGLAAVRTAVAFFRGTD